MCHHIRRTLLVYSIIIQRFSVFIYFSCNALSSDLSVFEEWWQIKQRPPFRPLEFSCTHSICTSVSRSLCLICLLLACSLSISLCFFLLLNHPHPHPLFSHVIFCCHSHESILMICNVNSCGSAHGYFYIHQFVFLKHHLMLKTKPETPKLTLVSKIPSENRTMNTLKSIKRIRIQTWTKHSFTINLQPLRERKYTPRNTTMVTKANIIHSYVYIQHNIKYTYRTHRTPSALEHTKRDR
jgi:hypothetical protein